MGSEAKVRLGEVGGGAVVGGCARDLLDHNVLTFMSFVRPAPEKCTDPAQEQVLVVESQVTPFAQTVFSPTQIWPEDR
jgi:hypothetical protein